MRRTIEQIAETVAKEITEADAIRRSLRHEEIDVEGKTTAIGKQLVILFTEHNISPDAIGMPKSTGLGSHLPHRTFGGIVCDENNKNNGHH